MAVGNALNIQQLGVVSFDGVANFIGSPLNQFSTLAAGTNNALVNVAPGTSGQVLTSNGPSSFPTYQGVPFTPNATVQLVDDFVNQFNASGSVQISAFPWYNNNIIWTSETTNVASTNPGLISNPAFASGDSPLFLVGFASGNNGNGLPIKLGGGTLSLNWVIKINTLSTGTNRYTLRLGFGDTANADQVNGVYFEYSDNINSGKWVIKTASGSSRTTTNTLVTVGTGYINLGMVINAAATSVTFSIAGAAQAPIVATIPTTSISPFIDIIRSAGTIAAASISIDLMYLNQILTTPR